MRRSLLDALVALVATLAVVGCGSDTPDVLRGYTREPAPDASTVTLPDAETGQEVTLVGPTDGLLILYFGYTSCPDVCPTTLADLRYALGEIGDDAERVRVAMATVDPERDTAEVLEDYLGFFVDDPITLRTTDDSELRAAANAFGADYFVTEGPDGEPEVGHTGSVFVVDDEGRIVVTWPFGTSSEDYVHDIELLLERT